MFKEGQWGGIYDKMQHEKCSVFIMFFKICDTVQKKTVLLAWEKMKGY